MREQRQREAVWAYLYDSPDSRSILNCAPRFGKIKCAIEIMKQKRVEDVLIFTPRVDIQTGWLSDFDKFKMNSERRFTPHFCTFTSAKDQPIGDHDFIIIDEPHELSPAQQRALKPFVKKYPTLGLTGTMTQKTRTELYNSLNLDVCYKYTIEQGVNDGILADYEIIIHKVPLDDTCFVHEVKKGLVSEKSLFNRYNYVRENKNSKFLDIKLIHIIQNSLAKANKTKELIDETEGRALVFCGTTAVADSLGIPVYHSGNMDKDLFERFCLGDGDKLATIKMMQAGVTVTPISRGIMNYISGNPEDTAQKICRFLGFEYDNPNKKAEIHIVSSTEGFEIMRLKTGLGFFDSKKIINL